MPDAGHLCKLECLDDAINGNRFFMASSVNCVEDLTPPVAQRKTSVEMNLDKMR